MVIWRLKQIGKVKKLSKLVSHELIGNQKNLIVLKCLLILCDISEPFIDQISDVQRKVDFIQLVMTTSSGCTKKLQSTYHNQNYTKNGSWSPTVRWSATYLIHCSFLNPSETITSEKYAQQIDKIH